MIVNEDIKCINAIRIISSEIVEKAKSGHPGAPIGLAPVTHILWTKYLNISPSRPNWTNRDRFVLSNGHSCALQYSMLHLSGFDITLEDLKKFRQLESKTPGHPEFGMTPGIECTTGPLGQGIAQAVGMAIGSIHAAGIYNKPGFEIVNHKIVTICGDGCLQEGISSETLSLAGHLKLSNLIVIYDDNKITIDGNTSLSFSEDVAMRLNSYGWNTLTIINGDEDFNSISKALKKAYSLNSRPTFISCKTTIGYSTTKENTHSVHGAPLGEECLIKFKNKIGHKSKNYFEIEKTVYEFYKKNVNIRGSVEEKKWQTMFSEYKKKYTQLASEFNRIFIQKSLPNNWKNDMPLFSPSDKKSATRNTSGIVLNKIATNLNELVGGSADLTPSNKTGIKCTTDFQYDNHKGRYIRFGVREHGMFGIGNGLSIYGFIPFTATFLNFITYGWGAVRISALSKIQQIFVMTHDSVFLGEDGPTHQPIEVLPLLRATPNLLTIRPADGSEVVGGWIRAIENRKGPSVLCLSRQSLPNLQTTNSELLNYGAYRLIGSNTSQITIISTGSEVNLCMEVAKLLKKNNFNISVISAPCLEIFDNQTYSYRSEILPQNSLIVSVEASSTFGWSKYATHHIGIDSFGISGNMAQICDYFGFTVDKIATKILTFT